MTPPIRLRRHTDGRWAVQTVDPPSHWVLYEPPGPGGYTRHVYIDEVSDPGWSELLVAELPEPDYELDGVEVWDLHTGEMTINHRSGELETPHLHAVDQLRSDALKMLAAVVACEKYQAEREKV